MPVELIDNVPLSQELLDRQLRDVFDLCDTNKSGYISIEHLVQLGKDHFGGRKQDVEAMVQLLDPGGMGVVSFDDFCRGVSSVLQSQATPTKNTHPPHIHLNGKRPRKEISQSGDRIFNDITPPRRSSTPRKPSNRSRLFLQPPNRKLIFLEPSLSMTATSNGQNSGLFITSNEELASSLTDADSAIGGSASPDGTAKSNNSQCSSLSDGENFECYGEGDEIELDAETNAPTVVVGDDTSSPSRSRSPNSNFLHRNTWLRTSLRRTPSNHETLPQRRWGSFRHNSGKRIGSNALASQLYRSSSFNSSGRSSNCDGDDMYSDVSLEEDVLDLNHKVQLLQQQVSALAETQNSTDDRYSRVKQENAALTARVHMLEEQLREVELRAEERLQDEQRRNRELTARADREKQLELENFAIRLQALDKECTSLREEATRLKQQTERLRTEKMHAEDAVSELEVSLQSTREELHKVHELSRREREEKERERNGNQQLVEELSREIERLRSSEHSVTANGLQVGGMNGHIGGRARSPSLVDYPSRLGELQNEVRLLRDENKNLHDANEELQAQILNRGLEEGRHLLTGTTHNSLAAEFEAMSQDEIKNALKEQKEVNAQLRSYIDGILLNIVENYPQLLEVKKKQK